MPQIPEDLPRRQFRDAQSFLTVARALIEIGAWVWRPKHQLAHSVTEFEAVNLVRFAAPNPKRVHEDYKYDDRWRVNGETFAGRRIGVSCSIWMAPAGEVVYFASAFSPEDA